MYDNIVIITVEALGLSLTFRQTSEVDKVHSEFSLFARIYSVHQIFQYIITEYRSSPTFSRRSTLKMELSHIVHSHSPNLHLSNPVFISAVTMKPPTVFTRHRTRIKNSNGNHISAHSSIPVAMRSLTLFVVIFLHNDRPEHHQRRASHPNSRPISNVTRFSRLQFSSPNAAVDSAIAAEYPQSAQPPQL